MHNLFEVFVDGAKSVNESYVNRTMYRYGTLFLNIICAGRFIRQEVFEKVDRYARLGGYCYAGSSSGVWRPDSVGLLSGRNLP